MRMVVGVGVGVGVGVRWGGRYRVYVGQGLVRIDSTRRGKRRLKGALS